MILHDSNQKLNELIYLLICSFYSSITLKKYQEDLGISHKNLIKRLKNNIYKKYVKFGP